MARGARRARARVNSTRSSEIRGGASTAKKPIESTDRPGLIRAEDGGKKRASELDQPCQLSAKPEQAQKSYLLVGVREKNAVGTSLPPSPPVLCQQPNRGFGKAVGRGVGACWDETSETRSSGIFLCKIVLCSAFSAGGAVSFAQKNVAPLCSRSLVPPLNQEVWFNIARMAMGGNFLFVGMGRLVALGWV